MKKFLVSLSMNSSAAVMVAWDEYIKAKQNLIRALEAERIEAEENAASGN